MIIIGITTSPNAVNYSFAGKFINIRKCPIWNDFNKYLTDKFLDFYTIFIPFII